MLGTRKIITNTLKYANPWKLNFRQYLGVSSCVMACVGCTGGAMYGGYLCLSELPPRNERYLLDRIINTTLNVIFTMTVTSAVGSIMGFFYIITIPASIYSYMYESDDENK